MTKYEMHEKLNKRYEEEGIEKKIWFFPFFEITRHSNIIIYGAGAVGQTYLEQISLLQHCNVICFLDKNKSGSIMNVPIILPTKEKINNLDFDYIIISIADTYIARDIMNNLLELGIPQKKVLWKDPLGNYFPKTRLTFEVQVAEHCNLNCKNCSHFSPIADEAFLDLKSFERDCKRLSDLFNGEMEYIHLMGGEPLLHPLINEVMRIARESFPKGKIELVTNGIILEKMNESFWETCKINDITIAPTQYPINVDYDKIKKIADKKQVKFRFYNDELIKTSFYWPISREARFEQEDNFEKCKSKNSCISLRDGYLYTCEVSCHIKHINKFYGMSYPEKENGVNIYEVQTGEELLNRMLTSVPMCKYCDLDNRSFHHEWGISKRNESEWIS